MSSSHAAEAVAKTIVEEEVLKRNLTTIIEQEISRSNTVLFAILSSNRVRIQKEMKNLSLKEDMKLLYSANGEPNTDINTWSIPALLFSVYCIFNKGLEMLPKKSRKKLRFFSKFSGLISKLENTRYKNKSEVRNAKEEQKYYKRILNRSVSMIKEYMIPEPVLDGFLEDDILTYGCYRDIQELVTTTEKNQKIYETVRAKGEHGYTAFKTCLLNSKQDLLYKYIEHVEKDENTEELRAQFKEEMKKQELFKRKEKRRLELTEENTVNSIEENLILAVKTGKDFEGEEDIEERMRIQGSTLLKTRECCYTIKCIFEQEKTDNFSDKIVTAIKDVTSMINVKVSNASVDKDNCVVITMSCSSSKEMRTLLKTLKGEQFSTGVSKLKDALTEEYTDTFRVEAKISPEQIRLVHEHLCNQGIIEKREEVSFCERHIDQQQLNEFICPEHDVFCCDECAKTIHRTCPGLRQITKDPILEEDSNHDDDNFPKSKKEYRVRIDETDLCSTKRICILPNSDIILIDNVNNRLKKLNMLYKIDGYCKFPKPPLDICLVDNFKILVSFGDTVSFVDTEGELKIQEELRLKKLCYCFAWHVDSIYYTDNVSLFSCDEKGNEHQVVYCFGEERITCNRIVVSNDKKKIYIAAGAKGLITVDVIHKTHSTFSCEELRECTYICIVKGGHLLVCDFKSHAVYQMDVEGNKVLKRVAEKSNGLQLPRSLDFDETDSTLVVGRLGRDFISVFDIEKVVSALQ